MSRLSKLLSSPWLWGVVALAGVGLFLYRNLHFPARPTGTRADIAKLSQRHDTNVVFILIDTLRKDHLSSYGYRRKTSPYMDRFASTGVRFANDDSQSTWTKCSMASLWTSTYPTTNGVTRKEDALPPAVHMPAEIIKADGFTTAGLYRNGWVEPKFGFGQGFDVYVKPPVDASVIRRIHRTASEGPKLAGSDWDVTTSAREFLRSHRHQRFFLYLHYMDVHQYVTETKSAIFGSSHMDSYDNAINWVDRNVADVVSELENLGIMDKTIVVIAADHGEAFGEHGTEGHAQNVYKEVDEVPLIFMFPFFLKPGVVIKAPIENVDIMPTILDLLGLPIPAGSQGHSLVGLMAGTEKGNPHRIQHTFLDRTWGNDLPPNPMVSIQEGNYRLITYASGKVPPQLFNDAKDPRETVNLASQEPARVAAMEPPAKQIFAGTKPPWGAAPEKVSISQMEMNMLRALGYVVGKGGKPVRRKAFNP